ncbi:MOSC domain-containing protein [Terriglobus aquaticus]|uniref:MOSC domain-containing protein n=1 Tax=Terriglobus aquaticus TaxID=940139 RepID=A0ABW9KGI9_9BACT|nr:MOSC domain-containing protein [Terriglobus aquaticus]
MPDGTAIAHIAELWRYPVKSMRGEQVDSLEVLADGIAGDRRYALVSSGAPVGKPRLTSRERAAMLLYSAHVSGNGAEIRTPGGFTFNADDPALLTNLEQNLPQQNRMTLQQDPGTGPYTDVRPISLVSTQTLAVLNRTFGKSVDPRRFRSNLVLTFTVDASHELTRGNAESFPEDALPGRTLRIGGTCRLRLLERIPRCRVVTLDPETSEPDPTLMKHLDRHHEGRLGIYAAVVTPGPLRVGDPVLLA